MNGSALDRLAELAGIEDGWWDFFGQYCPVPPETKRAFLTAMGFFVGSDEEIEQSLAAIEEAPWRRPLEPVLVATEGDDFPAIAVTLPADIDGQSVKWTLEEELGARHRGTFMPADLPLVGEAEIDGRTMRRRALTLPGLPQVGLHGFLLDLPDGQQARMTVIMAPAMAWLPPEIKADGRLWGVATQLYALRRDKCWGMGDFTDLARLGRGAATLGASLVGVNPLHALFPSRPERFSPYSPSARRFLDVFYIDVEAVPDFQDSVAAKRLYASPGFQARLAAAENARLIDYQTMGAAKLNLLKACWDHFRQTHTGRTRRGRDFQAFVEQGGAGAWTFATFEALQEHFLETDPNLAYWRFWPVAFQSPDSPEVVHFAEDNKDRVLFFLYLQWLADGQLAGAQKDCRAAGMSVGVYRDLGVGIADDGAEAWANQSRLCLGVSIGAPPDPLNLAGQDWGLAPFNPIALREAAYRPFLDVLEANMTHAGAMRLDHAMSLQRLYWVPRGAKADQGAYVRYPVEDLFALVALASRRRRCLVIGEDLGTVPEGFRERMEERGILGYRLMVFEKDGEGRFKAPEDLAREALVGIGTHDLPSLSGWWAGIDIESRKRLVLYPDAAMAEQEAEGRAADRKALAALLVEEGLLPSGFPTGPDLAEQQASDLAAAFYAYLDRSPSRLLMVQFEDVLGLSLQMNLPGTSDQHPNWRARYPEPLGAMLKDKRIKSLAKTLQARSGKQR